MTGNCLSMVGHAKITKTKTVTPTNVMHKKFEKVPTRQGVKTHSDRQQTNAQPHAGRDKPRRNEKTWEICTALTLTTQDVNTKPSCVDVRRHPLQTLRAMRVSACLARRHVGHLSTPITLAWPSDAGSLRWPGSRRRGSGRSLCHPYNRVVSGRTCKRLHSCVGGPRNPSKPHALRYSLPRKIRTARTLDHPPKHRPKMTKIGNQPKAKTDADCLQQLFRHLLRGCRL